MYRQSLKQAGNANLEKGGIVVSLSERQTGRENMQNECPTVHMQPSSSTFLMRLCSQARELHPTTFRYWYLLQVQKDSPYAKSNPQVADEVDGKQARKKATLS